MKRVIVVAPHADDETLGCGGTLLRHIKEGDEVHWLLVTDLSEALGYTALDVERREKVIAAVTQRMGFRSVHRGGFPTTTLDTIGARDLVGFVSRAAAEVQPEIAYVPHQFDVHSDHRCVFEACMAAFKWFRSPGIRRIAAYETLSETEAGRGGSFRPNLYVDISAYLDAKVDMLGLYGDELGEHPFPRSEHSVRSLSAYRGAAAGVQAAEAFESIWEAV